MTLTFRFSPSDMIIAGGTAYRPLEVQQRGTLFERVGQPGITQLLSHDETSEMMRRPDTQFYHGYFERSQQEIRQNKSVSLLSELSDDLRNLVLWRSGVCRAFLIVEAAGDINRTPYGYEKGKAKLVLAVEGQVRDQSEKCPKPRPGTVVPIRSLPQSRAMFEWVRTYEKSGFQAASLIPETHRCGNRTRR